MTTSTPGDPAIGSLLDNNHSFMTLATLEQAHAFVEQLADIYDFVSPCFPPKYDMFRVIFRKYHEHMAFMLDCVGACAESLANADILKARVVAMAIARQRPPS